MVSLYMEIHDHLDNKIPGSQDRELIAVIVFYDLVRSAIRSVETIGMTSMPQKKLLTPWIKSKGSPARIQDTIPSKLRPNRIA